MRTSRDADWLGFSLLVRVCEVIKIDMLAIAVDPCRHKSESVKSSPRGPVARPQIKTRRLAVKAQRNRTATVAPLRVVCQLPVVRLAVGQNVGPIVRSRVAFARPPPEMNWQGPQVLAAHCDRTADIARLQRLRRRNGQSFRDNGNEDAARTQKRPAPSKASLKPRGLSSCRRWRLAIAEGADGQRFEYLSELWPSRHAPDKLTPCFFFPPRLG